MPARAVTRFAVWMLILTALNFLLPDQHVFVWTTIGVSSVAAILIGTWRNSPRKRPRGTCWRPRSRAWPPVTSRPTC